MTTFLSIAVYTKINIIVSPPREIEIKLNKILF